MLKARVIGVVPVKEGWAVQCIGFRRYLPIGRPEISVEYLDRYGVDEIALLDISATPAGRGPDLTLLNRCAPRCHVPIAFGGGVTTVAQMHDLIRHGADKVVLNSGAFENPHLIEEGASHFGSQCMVVAIDARLTQGGYEIVTHCGTKPRGLDPATVARKAEQYGAGEILINSIDRDGTKQGYDTALIRTVRSAVAIPVIALGGVGRPEDMAAGLSAGADAVAAANIFNYTEHSVALAKRILANTGADLRLDNAASYENARFDESGRLAMQPEDVLEDLLFVRISEEVI